MDNAFKWSKGIVYCETRAINVPGEIRAGLVIKIADDGGGISPDQRRLVLQRGIRADEKMDGQGIGLCVANEIVERYAGTITISTGALGGAEISIEFPPIVNNLK
ncbi:MAG: hypothetical protein GKR96_14230 [Gammaproteobacteria bacterium]|nr:hypothetical protein [Gammaproteobacteria bacterium]